MSKEKKINQPSAVVSSAIASTALGAAAGATVIAHDENAVTSGYQQHDLPFKFNSDIERLLNKPDTRLTEGITLGVKDLGNTSITDILDNTPVRGLRINIELVTDQNGNSYYALVQPSATNPPQKLTDAFDEIKTWIDTHPDQFLTLDFNTPTLSPAQTDEAYSIFSNSLVDANHNFAWTSDVYLGTQSGVMPTIQDLTSQHKNFYYMDSTPGSTYNTEDAKFLNVDFDSTAGSLTVDQLKKPGIHYIDQYNLQDPRINETPSYADQDQTFAADLLHTKDPIAFDAGVFATSASATLSAAGGIYAAVQNENYISSIKSGREIENIISRLDQDIAKKGPVTSESIKQHCKKQVMNTITKRSVIPGLFSTFGISGAILSASLLFPPAFVGLAIASLVTLGVGAIGSGVAAYFNRKRIGKEFDKAFASPRIKKIVDGKIEDIKSGKLNLLSKEERKFDDSVQNAGNAFTVANMAMRVSSMAKYAMPMIGAVAGLAAPVIATLSGAYKAVVNYRARQKRFVENAASGVADYILSGIDKKPHLGIFGKSVFDKYVEKNYDFIAQELDLKGKKNIAKLKDELNDPDNEKAKTLLGNLRQNCLKDHYAKEFATYQKANGSQANFKDFLHAKIEKEVIKDVGVSGMVATTAISASLAGASVFTPFATPFLLIASAASFALGSVVTAVTGLFEKSKIKKSVAKCFDKIDGADPESKKLKSIIDIVNPTPQVVARVHEIEEVGIIKKM